MDMKLKILTHALRLAARHGLDHVSRNDIAVSAEVATGSVSYHFENMRKLRAAIVAKAIEDENLIVIGQALVARHPLALKASDALKKRAAAALTA